MPPVGGQYLRHGRGPHSVGYPSPTEHALGRLRVRVRTMGGIGSWAGLEAAFPLCHLKVA